MKLKTRSWTLNLGVVGAVLPTLITLIAIVLNALNDSTAKSNGYLDFGSGILSMLVISYAERLYYHIYPDLATPYNLNRLLEIALPVNLFLGGVIGAFMGALLDVLLHGRKWLLSVWR